MKNEIFIHTDRGSYVGGDVVYGCVYVSIIQPISAQALYIEFKGYEKVDWEEEETQSYQENGETRTRTIKKDYHGDKTFFK